MERNLDVFDENGLEPIGEEEEDLDDFNDETFGDSTAVGWLNNICNIF
jgi:hypothetical protein